MEVRSNIIDFPGRPVAESEFFNRALRASEILCRGCTDIGPLTLYGPHKERISLLRWAMAGRHIPAGKRAG